MKQNEKSLLKEIHGGSKPAFKLIFQKYYKELSWFAYSYTKDKSAAEEAVQEFFVKFWENRERLFIKKNIKSYMYTSVRNTVLNGFNDKHNKMLNTEIPQIKITDEPMNRDENIDKKTFRKLYKQAVNVLPEKCKKIYLLSRNSGLTYKEIAEYTQLSEKTIENQMGIALKKLREFLRPHLSRIYV